MDTSVRLSDTHLGTLLQESRRFCFFYFLLSSVSSLSYHPKYIVNMTLKAFSVGDRFCKSQIVQTTQRSKFQRLSSLCMSSVSTIHVTKLWVMASDLRNESAVAPKRLI